MASQSLLTSWRAPRIRPSTCGLGKDALCGPQGIRAPSRKSQQRGRQSLLWRQAPHPRGARRDHRLPRGFPAFGVLQKLSLSPGICESGQGKSDKPLSQLVCSHPSQSPPAGPGAPSPSPQPDSQCPRGQMPSSPAASLTGRSTMC